MRHEGTLRGKTLTRVDDGYIAPPTLNRIPHTVYTFHSFTLEDFEIRLKLPVTIVNVSAVTARLVFDITATFTIRPLVENNSVTNVYHLTNRSQNFIHTRNLNR